MSRKLSYNFEDPRKVLRRHGLHPRRAMSQNFLIDRHAVERIANETLSVSLPIVELGSGLGTLTAALVGGDQRIVAIEKDKAMIEVLRAEFGDHPQLQIEHGDASTVDLSAWSERLEQKLAVAGNLPYAITGAIMRNVVASRDRIGLAVLMVQHEVYERLQAQPGKKTYGALSVFVQAQFAVERILQLGPNSFFPPPSVRSAVVTLKPLSPPQAEETNAFAQVVRASFQQRRKTLRNALSAQATPEVVDRALDAAQIDGKRRGETLSVEEFARIARAWDGKED